MTRMPKKRAIAVLAKALFCLLLLVTAFGAAPVPPASGEPLSAKQRSTYYTAEKIAAARANIAKFDWAQAISDSAVSAADDYLQLGLDRLWGLITSQSVPRSYAVNQDAGSPVKGRAIDQYGNYPYKIDPVAGPWKLTDPSSGFKFPTNDFAAYYRSGLDASGRFDRARADKKYLVNTLYPEKGAKWGVDDGTGWVDANGRKFMFVAYYNHWGLWRGIIEKALTSFRDAYLYTGDVKYADAGIVMLDRIADVYPDMDVSAYKQADGYRHSDGGTGQGKIVGSIWEALLVRELVSCYDAFFPAFRDNSAAVAFLRGKAAKLKLPGRKDTAEGIKVNIENGLVRQVYAAVQTGKIFGNVGFHQSALAMAAVVLDDPATVKQWLDFIFRPGGLSSAKGQWSVTGGNLGVELIDRVDRDGFGDEASPEYNSLWLDYVTETADILDNYDRYPDADLYKNPKLKKMFGSFIDLIMAGRYTPSIGDSGAAGKPLVLTNPRVLVKGYAKYGDPRLAQAAYRLNGNSAKNMVRDIFQPEPDRLQAEMEDVIARSGPLQQDSINLTGYGLGVLRSDAPPDQQHDLWMYYGRNYTAHSHADALTIGMHAFGLDLAPDLGYPSFADGNALRKFWELNTVNHNTVAVDRAKQQAQWVGLPRHFDDGRNVKLLDVEAPKAYPQTSQYRRTTAMIKADEANAYYVDFFRVFGGSDHVFSFHAADGTVSTQDLNLQVQAAGTYAGSDVEYGSGAYNKSSTSGFNYLKNVRKDGRPPAAFSVDWKIADTWKALPSQEDIHLRLTMIGDTADVALADGIPPQNKPGNPKQLTYLLAHRTGTNLNSVFTSVIEPYRGSRVVASVQAVPVTKRGAPVPDTEVRALKITLVNGRTDYAVMAADTETPYVVDNRVEFQGFFGVVSFQGAKQSYAYVNDGKTAGAKGAPLASLPSPRVTGSVTDFTKQLGLPNAVRISPAGGASDPADWAGQYLYVDNDYTRQDGKQARNAVYAIRAAAAEGGSAVSVDIGDITLVRGWVQPGDASKGFEYDAAAGNTFRIPLSAEVIKRFFVDVPDNYWASAAIDALSDRNIVQGVTDTRFEPEASVTRAEFTALLARAFGLKPRGSSAFADVRAGDWFYPEVTAAAEAGLVEGTGPRTFSPEDTLLREEMAAMLVRAYNRITGGKLPNGLSVALKDAAQVSEWAKPFVQAAYESKLLEGRAPGIFAPIAHLTRAEAAQAIVNLLGKTNK